jgi:glucose-6-phosphate isomerase
LLSALSSAPDKIIYWENIDPRAFTNLCQSLDITRTAVLVITKSGKTIETVAQFLALFDFWRRIVVKPQKHFWFITDPEPNPMRDLATQLGIECLEHPQEIGGRYATFTVVGLLPAYLADLDVAAFLTGAKTVLNNWLNQEESDPESGALFQFHGMLLNHSMTVFMPYIASLYALSNWFCQLWSESLGKGGQGTTPIRASGPLDQHSQLQLYLDGPNDKIFTFITEHHTHTKNIISPNLAGADSLTQLLAKTSLGALVEAEQEATIATVARHSRPVRVIALNQLKEAELGSLCMHIMLETLIVAEAMGVDPFSQPAVEEGKRLALEALNNRV